jgi:hypothetical protein
MRSLIALLAAVIILVGMFIFSAVMQRQVQAWANQGAALTPAEQLLVSVANAWTQYWYLGVLAITALCAAIVFITAPRDERQ